MWRRNRKKGNKQTDKSSQAGSVNRAASQRGIRVLTGEQRVQGLR